MIIPVYNVRPYIEEALDSVIGQTYRKLEIIIIDDGSTDGSGEICDRYAEQDCRIKVYHQENKGLSAARNTGLDVSMGPVIAFLDPDDAFAHDMISKMMEGMEEYQADIMICGFSVHESQERMEQEETETPVLQLCDKNEAFLKLVNDEINTAVWNRLYKKSVWNDLRFPAGRVYEGTYTSCDIFDRVEKVVITNEKLVLHRIRPGSICKTICLKNIMDSFYSNDHFLAYVKTHTPVIFSEKDLRNTIQKRVKGRILAYLSCYERKSNMKMCRSNMREKLVFVKEDLADCGFILQICYYCALLFPRISAMLYSAYRRMYDVLDEKE